MLLRLLQTVANLSRQCQRVEARLETLHVVLLSHKKTAFRHSSIEVSKNLVGRLRQTACALREETQWVVHADFCGCRCSTLKTVLIVVANLQLPKPPFFGEEKKPQNEPRCHQNFRRQQCCHLCHGLLSRHLDPPS